MSRAGENDFDLIRGDTFIQRLTYTDSAGAPLDVSLWTFLGQVRADPDDETALADFEFGLDDAVDGIVVITLAAADTATFTGPFVHYDIQCTDTEDIVTTAPRGRLRIIKDVTREEAP